MYKVKLNLDGSLERLKARLVIQGNHQKHGVDYVETFSPVIKMSRIRSIIALAATRHWPIHQLDINNAFLHRDLYEEVYMKVPIGIPNSDNKVCKPMKSLCGLKQASRQWFAKLRQALQSQGYVQSKNDYNLFIRRSGSDITIVGVYVDDIIITGSNVTAITELKSYLHITFTIKDLGLLHYILGIEVNYIPNGIVLSQRKFTQELLNDNNLLTAPAAKTPLPQHFNLKPDEGEPLLDPTAYRTIIGKLNFMTNTRPDFSFSVQTLSQFMQSIKQPHLDALFHLLRYIKGTTSHGILLKGSDQLTLQAFLDSDWASCPTSRRSVTGYVVLFGGSPISWKSKKQSTVAKSSSEAEYRAMSQAASELTWLVRLLDELGVQNLNPVKSFCDNQSALHIARNPVFHERTKHIDIDCHFTREKVMEGLIELRYLPSKSQLADVLTKILPSSVSGIVVQAGSVWSSILQLEGGNDISDKPANGLTTQPHYGSSSSTRQPG